LRAVPEIATIIKNYNLTEKQTASKTAVVAVEVSTDFVPVAAVSWVIWSRPQG
jgi:hypothetical protein